MCRFFDDLTVHEYVEILYRKTDDVEIVHGFNKLIGLLKQLMSRMGPVNKPGHVLEQPEWPEIRSSSSSMMNALETLSDEFGLLDGQD